MTGVSAAKDEGAMRRFDERAATNEEAAGAGGLLTYESVVDRWCRQQWDPFTIALDQDRETYLSSSLEEQRASMLPVYHRVAAEDLVAGLMNNLILAAPSKEAAAALATQLSDEVLHVRSIMRVCEEVYGIQGGQGEILNRAAEFRDPATEVGFEALKGLVEPLGKNSTSEDFLRSEVGYSWIGEGSLARTAQYYTKDMKGYPGIKEGQRNVARDEARHIQIGVIVAKEALSQNYDQARDAIMDVVGMAANVMGAAIQMHEETGEADRYVTGYGVPFREFTTTAVKFLLMRLRSAGLKEDAKQLERRLLEGRGLA